MNSSEEINLEGSQIESLSSKETREIRTPGGKIFLINQVETRVKVLAQEITVLEESLEFSSGAPLRKDEDREKISQIVKLRQEVNILFHSIQDLRPGGSEEDMHFYSRMSHVYADQEAAAELHSEFERCQLLKKETGSKSAEAMDSITKGSDALKQSIASIEVLAQRAKERMEAHALSRNSVSGWLRGLLPSQGRVIGEEARLLRRYSKGLNEIDEDDLKRQLKSDRGSFHDFVEDWSSKADTLKALGIDHSLLVQIKSDLPSIQKLITKVVPDLPEDLFEKYNKMAWAFGSRFSQDKMPKVLYNMQYWLDHLKAVYLAFDGLNVSELSELQADKMDKQAHRSFETIRHAIILHLIHNRSSSFDVEELIKELKSEAENIKDDLVLSYSETGQDVIALLESGRILTIFDLPKDEQKKRSKGLRSLDEVLFDRKAIHTALGWSEDESSLAMVIDDSSDELESNGSGVNYGSVRFVFDFEGLKDHTSFTASDSLNSLGLPNSISELGGDVASRQIAAVHVPIMKAIFNLAREGDHKNVVRYLEAQVGGVDGGEVFNYLTKVVVDQDELKRELQRSDTSEKEVLEALSKFCEARSISWEFWSPTRKSL
ncbi:MAG: hypothetical protein ACI9QC_000032 [Oceanicoccus sp.]|jgi:hypothetical protein